MKRRISGAVLAALLVLALIGVSEAKLLAACFVATTVDFIPNFTGLSTAVLYLIVFQRLPGGEGVVVLYRIPVTVGAIIMLKAAAFLLSSILYEMCKESLPAFLAYAGRNPKRSSFRRVLLSTLTRRAAPVLESRLRVQHLVSNLTIYLRMDRFFKKV